MSGCVVHFEVPFDNADQARGLYQKAFGWSLMPMPEMSYTVASTGPTGEQGMPSEPGFINGGLVPRPEPFKGPVLTVDADDIDAALAKIEEHGGITVRPRQEVGGMGFTAYFSDPEGNLMGLWQSA